MKSTHSVFSVVIAIIPTHLLYICRWHFQVVVVQWGQRNVQTIVIHVQSCFFFWLIWGYVHTNFRPLENSLRLRCSIYTEPAVFKSSVWTQRKHSRIPCEPSVWSNFSAGRKFIPCSVNVAKTYLSLLPFAYHLYHYYCHYHTEKEALYQVVL